MAVPWTWDIVQFSTSLQKCPTAENGNRWKSLKVVDRRLEMCSNKTSGMRTQSLWYKPEQEVVLAAILYSGGAKFARKCYWKFWGISSLGSLKYLNFTNTRWRRPPIWKPLNRHISATAWPIFTAWCYASTVLASVCLCLSQVGVLLKRLNRGSQKQHHTIARGL